MLEAELADKPMVNKELSDEEANLTPWFSTCELLEYLGISETELAEQAKLFAEGIHYRVERSATSEEQMLWRLDLIDELLCLPIAPLEKEAMLNAMNNRITCK